MPLSYEDAVKWYYSFARFDSHAPRAPDDVKLARMRQVLARLGNPHETFPSILLAGTKGKGSTAAMIESILRAAGYRTGLYTSPHLHSFRERVQIGGALISKQRVIAITRQLQRIETSIPRATFFEWVTALAFTNYAREKIDIAVVEVGLGGRLDCTNVLTPRVCVITPISYDHMEILGDTLAQIAYEKAGIIKPNIPVVVAPQESEAMRVIENVAREKNARLISVERDWQWNAVRITPAQQLVTIQQAQENSQAYRLPLLGPHQRANLATALATTEILRAQGWKIPPRAMRAGVAKVKWHARFEILSSSPFVVADGAHNRASARELVRTLDEVSLNARVHFVFGASADKDIVGMLSELAPRAATFIFTQAQHARAASPKALAQLAAPYKIPMYIASDFTRAFEIARDFGSSDDVICVTGSLFIAAEARERMLNVRGDK